MAIDLSGLQAQIANTISIEQSAIILINGIAAEINAAVASADANTQAEVTALTSQLQTSAASLAAAVAAQAPANTASNTVVSNTAPVDANTIVTDNTVPSSN